MLHIINRTSAMYIKTNRILKFSCLYRLYKQVSKYYIIFYESNNFKVIYEDLNEWHQNLLSGQSSDIPCLNLILITQCIVHRIELDDLISVSQDGMRKFHTVYVGKFFCNEKIKKNLSIKIPKTVSLFGKYFAQVNCTHLTI